MTTNLTTRVSRDHWGKLKAESNFDLGNNLDLEFSTYKDGWGDLMTTATVSKVNGNYRTHAFSFGGSGDFCTQIRCERIPRVTKKVLLAFHTKSLEQADAIIEQARAHYAAKVPA